jgi:hypothetical protein
LIGFADEGLEAGRLHARVLLVADEEEHVLAPGSCWMLLAHAGLDPLQARAARSGFMRALQLVQQGCCSGAPAVALVRPRRALARRWLDALRPCSARRSRSAGLST